MWSARVPSRPPFAGRPTALRLGFHLTPGMRVGLYGGSFDPAHAGHAHVAATALKRLGLNRILWLVSPGNPLKQSRELEKLDPRIAATKKFARGRRMVVSDAERRLGARYTLDTVRLLKARHPAVRFVWIMGADNLATFHLWRGWIRIFHEVPAAIVSRPGNRVESRFSPLARRFASSRLPAGAAQSLATRTPPAWIYLTARLHSVSSTVVRNSPDRSLRLW